MGGTLRPNDPPKWLGPWTIYMLEVLTRLLIAPVSAVVVTIVKKSRRYANAVRARKLVISTCTVVR